MNARWEALVASKIPVPVDGYTAREVLALARAYDVRGKLVKAGPKYDVRSYPVEGGPPWVIRALKSEHHVGDD